MSAGGQRSTLASIGALTPAGMSTPVGNPAMFWSMAYKVSDVLMVLTEAGALERLAQAPATADALAVAVGWQAGSLAKLLDLLVTAGVLEKSDAAVYAVPSTTRSVLPVVVMEAQVRRWHAANRSLLTVLETGVGADPLGQIQEQNFLSNYQQAMAASARALALHIHRYARLPRQGTILDIGGADGALAEQLALLQPQTDFCIIDRPPVREHFEMRMARVTAPQRFRFSADDITQPQALQREADTAIAAIISNVLHLLCDRQIRELLRLLCSELPSGARVVIYDQFLDPTQFSAANLMVVDWVNLGAEFELADGDMAELLAGAGFIDISSRRFPLIPGALVCASVP
ncbi:MAG TPA: methyltransferase [Noviherbaspirillum sp.]